MSLHYADSNATIELDCEQVYPRDNAMVTVDHTRKKLKQTQQERNRLCEEKDEEIANQRVKIASMGTQYESVLMVCLFAFSVYSIVGGSASS